jgi:dihydrofolate synthase/folylpolyglutamate synthase
MMRKHTYVSAEKFILSREFFGMKLGLDNITEFLSDIGSPQNQYLTIHIAGTNGKGSTASILASVLHAAGYKTGLFTSPHLVSLRERVTVNNRRISTRSVTAFVDRNRVELTRRKLSFFELVTAMALDHFQRSGVDIAVIETGLGGRLDATNVLAPILTVITDISRDHMEILGHGLPRIAREKAGIIKPSVPNLVGLLPEEAEKVIRSVCARRHAPFHRMKRSEFTVDIPRMRLDFISNGFAYSGLRPSLYGQHQLRNSALALKALALLQQSGLAISKKAVYEGLDSTHWPGRFQVIIRRNRPTHVFDVGHNVGGVQAFVESFQNRFPEKKSLIITGFVKKKEHQKMFDALSSIAGEYALVPLKSQRSMPLDELMEQMNWRSIKVRKFSSLEAAYKKLLKQTTSDDIISVIGSHYLVGEFFGKFNVK